jgi:bifunctional pyridoxal-dependent enzyme with beta-cystathionase and maltose regulon repressor activities
MMSYVVPRMSGIGASPAIRVSFANSRSILEQASQRMRRACEDLR